jgi:hypothetical protein
MRYDVLEAMYPNIPHVRYINRLPPYRWVAETAAGRLVAVAALAASFGGKLDLPLPFAFTLDLSDFRTEPDG